MKHAASRLRGRSVRSALALLLFLLLTSCATATTEAQAGAPDSAAPAAAHAAGVLINEILAHTDPPQVDSVEFYNPTSAEIAMAGWWFADGPDVEDRITLPADARVPAGGFWVLELPENGPLRLSEMGEKITLTAVGGNGAPSGYVQEATFGVSPNGVSLGRVQIFDGAADPIFYPLQSALTLGAPNAAPRLGPVQIAEVMYHPIDNKPEYIELVNTSSAPVLLYDPLHPENRWQVEGVGGYFIPAGMSLAPGASLFVAGVGPDLFRNAYSLPATVAVVGPFAGGLDNKGDRVALLSPEPPNLEGGPIPYAVVDEVDYRPDAPWPTAANGEGPALARSNFSGFGQDPQNWAASTLPLEAGPTAFIVRSDVLPSGGGGRTLTWSTAAEWRLTGFTLWRAPAGRPRADAVAVGGAVQPHNNRHLRTTYTVIDAQAQPNDTFIYWIEATTATTNTLALATLSAPPIKMVMLPVVRNERLIIGNW